MPDSAGDAASGRHPQDSEDGKGEEGNVKQEQTAGSASAMDVDQQPNTAAVADDSEGNNKGKTAQDEDMIDVVSEEASLSPPHPDAGTDAGGDEAGQQQEQQEEEVQLPEEILCNFCQKAASEEDGPLIYCARDTCINAGVCEIQLCGWVCVCVCVCVWNGESPYKVDARDASVCHMCACEMREALIGVCPGIGPTRTTDNPMVR